MLPPLMPLDGSTASTATRRPARTKMQAQRFDERALADARCAGDANANRLSGVRQQPRQQLLGLQLVRADCSTRSASAHGAES